MTPGDRSHPTPAMRARVRIPPRMDLASKNPPGGPNFNARHHATDILTDTSPAFRPLFAHGLRQRSPVNRSARAAPRSAGASTRTASGQVALGQQEPVVPGVLDQPPTRLDEALLETGQRPQPRCPYRKLVSCNSGSQY